MTFSRQMRASPQEGGRQICQHGIVSHNTGWPAVISSITLFRRRQRGFTEGVVHVEEAFRPSHQRWHFPTFKRTYFTHVRRFVSTYNGSLSDTPLPFTEQLGTYPTVRGIKDIGRDTLSLVISREPNGTGYLEYGLIPEYRRKSLERVRDIIY